MAEVGMSGIEASAIEFGEYANAVFRRVRPPCARTNAVGPLFHAPGSYLQFSNRLSLR